MPDNRPAVYLEGDNVIYRASALGHPICQLWAARCGLDAKPFPDSIQKAMDEGTELEDHILNLLYEEHGFSFGYKSQQFQVELNVGAWNGKTLIVRGKVDEIGGPSEDTFPHIGKKPLVGNLVCPIDVKAFSQSLVDEYRTKGLLAFPRYGWQQSVYTHGYNGVYFFMPIYNKETEKIEPWSLEPIEPPFTREQIRDRVLEVEEHFYSNQMPPCPGEYGCQYYYLHEGKPEVESLPTLVTQMVRARINLSNKIRVLDNARKTLDDAISPKLTVNTRYGYDDYTIQVIENARRFNTSAAKALLTDAEVDWENDPDFWIPGNGTQLRMTPPKKRSDNLDP